MPRSGSGNYTLPTGNPVVTGTTIETTWANNTLSDIATAMSDSLSRSGQGGMTAAFRSADGSNSVPGISFSNETTTGIYRAGSADLRLAVTTNQIQQWLTTGSAITGTLSVSGALTATGGVVGNVTGNVTGNVSGNAGTVTNGVYTVGDQTVGGVKTFSANPVLNAGTANGVAYINGSNVLTSSTALTFDGSNLGVGTNNPIEVVSAFKASGASYGLRSTNFTYVIETVDSSGSLHIGRNDGVVATRLAIDASGNLGVGTASPGAKLDVAGLQRTGGNATNRGDVLIQQSDNTVAGSGGLEFKADGANSGYGARIKSLFNGISEYDLGFQMRNNSASWSTPMLLDASGNLGLGVTPSAWSSGSTAFQNSAGAIWRFGTNNIYFGQNYYWNGTNRIYSTTNAATEYEQGVGSHKWYVAPSGTAGNPISFTQAMTLGSDGNLALGGTGASPSGLGGRSFAINTTGTNYGGLELSRDGNYIGALRIKDAGADNNLVLINNTANSLIFGTSNTERARIDSSGNLLVGTTSNSLGGSSAIICSGIIASGAPTTSGYNNVNSASLEGSAGRVIANHLNGTTSGTLYAGFSYNGAGIGSITQDGTTAVLYNTTSDQRLKENIVDAPEASALIDSIQVRSFDWKSDGSHQRYGMVAQELHAVAPEAVHKPADPEEMMAVDYSKLVPMLIKEIQSLRARVAALESK